MKKLTRLIYIGIGLSCLLFSESFAAEEKILRLLVDDGTGKQRVELVRLQNGMAEYITELGGKVVSVDLSMFGAEVPQKIVMRSITGWAVGEGGPWVPLEGIDRAGTWKEVKAEISTLLLPEMSDSGDRPMSPEQYQTAYSHLAESEDAERWLPVLRTCQGQQQGACYSYHAADEIKFTWPDQSTNTLTIYYPGGC